MLQINETRLFFLLFFLISNSQVLKLRPNKKLFSTKKYQKYLQHKTAKTISCFFLLLTDQSEISVQFHLLRFQVFFRPEMLAVSSPHRAKEFTSPDPDAGTQ